MEYDALNRPTKQVDALGGVSSTSYDQMETLRLPSMHWAAHGICLRLQKSIISMTNALGGVFSYAYDAVDNVIRTTDEANRTFQYAFDSLNRLTKVTDPLGGVESFGYDATDQSCLPYRSAGSPKFSRVRCPGSFIENRWCSGEITQYSYDRVGNLIQKTDPLGRQTKWVFDDWTESSKRSIHSVNLH